MAEENTNVQATETTEGQTPDTQPAQQPGTTPPQAATVDIDAITQAAAAKAEEAAARKMETVFKSMLEQQNLDAATIAKMTEEWKANQTTPETTIADLTSQNEVLGEKNSALEKQIVALGKGVPADLVEKYAKLAETYVDDKTGFDAALDAAIVDFPLKNNTPTVTKSTNSASSGVDVDEFQKRIKKYKKD